LVGKDTFAVLRPEVRSDADPNAGGELHLPEYWAYSSVTLRIRTKVLILVVSPAIPIQRPPREGIPRTDHKESASRPIPARIIIIIF